MIDFGGNSCCPWIIDFPLSFLQLMPVELQTEPIEGIAAELIDESNLFSWRVYLEGPKDTL
jgi:hypothetical protein